MPPTTDLAYADWLLAVDLFLGVVLALNQDLGDVVLTNDVRRQLVGRNDLLAVVVRLRVVDLGVLASKDVQGHRDGRSCELAGVLEDGGVLLTSVDGLDRVKL